MGPPLQIYEKDMVFKVHKFFLNRKKDRESTEHKMDMNVNKLVAEATGVSARTVMRIVSEGRTSEQNTGQVIFTAPLRPKEIKKKIVLEGSQIEVIQSKINDYHIKYKKMPSIPKLNAMLKKDGIVNCGNTYLRNLLNQMGYSLNRGKSKTPVKIEITADLSSADSRVEAEGSDSSNLASGAVCGIDSSGEYSDFDDEQAEREESGEDETPRENYQIEVDQDELSYDVCKLETVEHNYTDEDKGQFVPATKENMPEVNMFAVVEYITNNEKELKHLDYPRLKILTKYNPHLISSPLVLPCPPTYRLRATVTLEHTTSYMCEVEYNTDTDTLTNSECLCGNDVCEHTAAFVMWLANKTMGSSTSKPKDNSGGDSGGAMLRKSQASDSGKETKLFANVVPSTSRVGGRDDAEGDQPPTKRPRVAGAVEGGSEARPADCDTALTVAPLPKDEDEPDKSKIECTFPRKTIYTLWENATGTTLKRSKKIQTTLRTQLQDDDFVIDFTPIEQRVEQLCVLFDKMKDELHKPEYSEFMNIKESIELDRISKGKSSSLRDPLS